MTSETKMALEKASHGRRKARGFPLRFKTVLPFRRLPTVLIGARVAATTVYSSTTVQCAAALIVLPQLAKRLVLEIARFTSERNGKKKAN